MQDTTVFTYRVSLSPAAWAKATDARAAAGHLWTRLVKIHRFCRRHWRWPTESPLKTHFKRRFPLHSQTVQALIEKFCATIDGVRTKRKNGDKKARYPWRVRRYFNPIFKGPALKMEGQHLLLPRGRGREPIRVHLPEALPTGRIVQAELGYGEIYLTVIREIPDPLPVPPGKAGGLDMGVIHLGMVSAPPRITYRRPVPLQGTLRRSPAEPRHVAGGISDSESGASHQGLTARGRSHGGSPRISGL